MTMRLRGADGRSLLDHLRRLEEDGLRDGQAKGLGGLEVDDELEGGGPLHRQVRRPGAFEDLVQVAARRCKFAMLGP